MIKKWFAWLKSGLGIRINSVLAWKHNSFVIEREEIFRNDLIAILHTLRILLCDIFPGRANATSCWNSILYPLVGVPVARQNVVRQSIKNQNVCNWVPIRLPDISLLFVRLQLFLDVLGKRRKWTPWKWIWDVPWQNVSELWERGQSEEFRGRFARLHDPFGSPWTTENHLHLARYSLAHLGTWESESQDFQAFWSNDGQGYQTSAEEAYLTWK